MSEGKQLKIKRCVKCGGTVFTVKDRNICGNCEDKGDKT